MAHMGRPCDGFMPTTSSSVTEKVYDEWADEYGSQVKAWGACSLLEKVSTTIAEVLEANGPSAPKTKSVLDAGCGVGLQGASLVAAGLGPLTGIDLSKEMLKKAEETGHYAACLQTDLQAPLSEHADNTYDSATCVAVLAHIDPNSQPGLLTELTRVVKPGGVVVFTNRTDMVGIWEPKAEELEAAGAWKLSKKEGPTPCYPGNAHYGEKVQVMIYAYTVQETKQDSSEMGA